MGSDTHATTTMIARRLNENIWRVRQALDALEQRGAEIPRCGMFRFVPLALLDDIRAEIQRTKKFLKVPMAATETQTAS